MDLALFESIYRRVGGEIVYTGASFGEYSSKWFSGYAMTRNGELNGPRRFIWSSDGDIYTLTYKDDELHGLWFEVSYDYIYVWVYREGTSIFNLKLYTSGRETWRSGSEKNSFTDL